MTYISFIDPPNDTIWNNNYSLFEPFQNSDARSGLTLFTEPFERLKSLAMKVHDSINLNIENKFLFFIFYKPLRGEAVEKIERYRVSTIISQIEKVFSFLPDRDNCYFVAIDQLKLNTFNEYEDEFKKIALELDDNGYLENSYYRDKYDLNHLFVSEDFQVIEDIWANTEFQESSNKELANSAKDEIIKILTARLRDKAEFFGEIGQKKNFLKQILKNFIQDFNMSVKNALYIAKNREKLQKLSPKKTILNSISKYYSAIHREIEYPVIYYRQENKGADKFYTEILSLANIFYYDTDEIFKEKNHWLFVKEIKLNNQDEAYSRLYNYLDRQYENLQTLQDSVIDVELYNQADKEIKFEHRVTLDNVKTFYVPYFYTKENKSNLETNINENNKIIDNNQHKVDKYINNEYKKFKDNFSSTPRNREVLKQEELEDRISDLSRDRERIRTQTLRSKYEAEYADVDKEFNRVSKYFDRLSKLSTFIKTTIFAAIFVVILFSIGFMSKTKIVPDILYGFISFSLLFFLASSITLDKYKKDCTDAYDKYYRKIKSVYENTHEELSHRINIVKSIMKSRYINYDYYLLKDTLDNIKLNAKKYQFHLDAIYKKKEFIDIKNNKHIISLDEEFPIAAIEHYRDIDTEKGVITNRTYALFSFNEGNISTVNISGREKTIKNSGFIDSVEIKATKSIL
jgi:hypothetical protein